MLLDYLKLMTFVLKKYKWLYLAFFILINFIMLPLCLSEISYSNVLQSDPQMLCFNFLQKNILLIYIIIQFNYPWSAGKSNYWKLFLCINAKKIETVISYFNNFLWNVGIQISPCFSKIIYLSNNPVNTSHIA